MAIKGYYWSDREKRYKARIKINKKYKHLGSFLFEEDAARVYKSFKLKQKT